MGLGSNYVVYVSPLIKSIGSFTVIYKYTYRNWLQMPRLLFRLTDLLFAWSP